MRNGENLDFTPFFAADLLRHFVLQGENLNKFTPNSPQEIPAESGLYWATSKTVEIDYILQGKVYCSCYFTHSF